MPNYIYKCSLAQEQQQQRYFRACSRRQAALHGISTKAAVMPGRRGLGACLLCSDTPRRRHHLRPSPATTRRRHDQASPRGALSRDILTMTAANDEVSTAAQMTYSPAAAVMGDFWLERVAGSPALCMLTLFLLLPAELWAWTCHGREKKITWRAEHKAYSITAWKAKYFTRFPTPLLDTICFFQILTTWCVDARGKISHERKKKKQI